MDVRINGARVADLSHDECCQAARAVLAGCRIEVRLNWTLPCQRFEDIGKLPEHQRHAKGVYAWVVRTGDEEQLARIGAARNLAARLLQYPRNIFDEVPGLEVRVAAVPAGFQDKLASLICQLYPEHWVVRSARDDEATISKRLADSDIQNLEYRLERLLLDEFRKRHDNQLPPGNFSSGSFRGYLRHLDLVQGACCPTGMGPADLSPSQKDLFRQTKRPKASSAPDLGEVPTKA